MDGDPTRLEALVGGPVLEIRPVGGGCIAGGSRVRTAGAAYFVKWGRGEVAATLEAEADGLRVLAAAAGTALRIPAVSGLAPEEGREPALLVLEWLDGEAWSDRSLEALGRGVAALHARTGSRYGHGRDNYIGRLPQDNRETADWPGFFRSRRLLPQAALARERGAWRQAWDGPFDRLCASLETLLPVRPPAATLHGDLWSGNAMPLVGGGAGLFDPAVYRGDRETDLAMARLFGGFGSRFFEAYGEAWPLEPGWRQREPVYRLYHLLSHLNHFGGAYGDAVDAIFRRKPTV